MATTIISQEETTGGNPSPPRTGAGWGPVNRGTTESSVWATLDSRRRPRDPRARRAPGGWGTRLEQSVAPGADERVRSSSRARRQIPRRTGGRRGGSAGTELVHEGIPIGTFFVIRGGRRRAASRRPPRRLARNRRLLRRGRPRGRRAAGVRGGHLSADAPADLQRVRNRAPVRGDPGCPRADPRATPERRPARSTRSPTRAPARGGGAAAAAGP